MSNEKGTYNSKRTFDNFVVGKNNKVAQAASLAVAESPGKDFNPLYIYGGSGLGKTHLMYAISNFLLENRPELKVLYVSSEEFVTDFIKAMGPGKPGYSDFEEFRQKYRTNDVLLIDDIQFIIGKESTQKEFFNTFNEMRDSGRQIIISSDKPPREMKIFDERLRSRFEWGRTVDIQPPDFETRMAILNEKQKQNNYHLEEKILTYIAENIKSDIRKLEGALTKVAFMGRVHEREITLEFARELIQDMISDEEKIGQLIFEVGKDVDGQTVVADLKEMQHLLVAGRTGSGKSVCLHSIIMNLLYKVSPDDAKLILIDSKMVEFNIYNGIPHLLIPVVTDVRRAFAVLDWAVTEMMERYKKFADIGVRDIESYNKKVIGQKELEQVNCNEIHEKMPRIVIIIDELADIMNFAHDEVEQRICRLAVLARAAGIHLVIAARPSADVITSYIKAHFPFRIAFQVASEVDSRMIIDMTGAEKLSKRGDMLFYHAGYSKPVYVRSEYVSDSEICGFANFLKRNNRVNYDTELESKLEEAEQYAASNGIKQSH